jgi:quercetin dioxygenase-like cupin family protein
MGTTPMTEAERGAMRVDPGGDRSFWVLGMLIRFKARSEETGGEYSLFEATVPPGLGAPPHIHHREAEAFYVLEGEFEFVKGEGVMRGTAGDFIHVPRVAAHGFTNVGPEPARILAILTPGGLHEQLFAALGEAGEPPSVTHASSQQWQQRYRQDPTHAPQGIQHPRGLIGHLLEAGIVSGMSRQREPSRNP